MSTLGFIGDAINNIFIFIMEVVNLIPKLVYYLSAAVMGLLDIAQLMLRKLAGLDVHYVGDGSAQTGDIVLSFLRGIVDPNSSFPALKNAFWSLIILAFILLFVTTIVATIRQEYMPGADEAKQKPSNTKSLVIQRAIKSLFMFLIVPVSVLFGLMLSDAVLVALDAATSNPEAVSTLTVGYDMLEAQQIQDGKSSSYIYYDFFGYGAATTTTPISGIVFKTSAFGSNRVRINNTYKHETPTGDVDKSFYELVDQTLVSNFNIFNKAETRDEMAKMIDEAFAANVKLKTPQSLIVEGSPAENDVGSWFVFKNTKVERFSKYNVGLVWYYYNLWQYNFIIAFAFLIICFKLMIKIAFGLMKRIIEMIALFLVSPPIVALMPLDNGKAFGQWRKTFIGKALAAYGAIVGMNILFLILPYLEKIKFMPEHISGTVAGIDVYRTGSVMVNLIIYTLFVLTGLSVVDSFIGLLGGIVGADDAAKSGGELVGKVGDTFGKSLDMTARVAGASVKAVTAPIKLGGKMIGGMLPAGGGGGGDKPPKLYQRKQTSQERQETADRTIEAWGNQTGEGSHGEAYYDYLRSNQDYNQKMQEEYENRDSSMQDLSFDNWMLQEGSTPSKQKVIDELVSQNKVQSKEDFAKAEDGAGAEYLNNLIQRNVNDPKLLTREELVSRRKQAIENSVIAQTLISGGKAVSNQVIGVGKNLSSFAGSVGGVMTDGFDGKVNVKGFESMINAFKGVTKKEMEKIKKYEDIKKEEAMRKEYYDNEKLTEKETERKIDEAIKKSVPTPQQQEEQIKKIVREQINKQQGPDS